MIKKISTNEEWAFFMDLLSTSFPESEYRNPSRIRAIADHKDSLFHPSIIYGEDGGKVQERIGLLGYWDFRPLGKDFIYGEHLAFLPSVRNRGMGTAILKELQQICKNILFEVELPEEEMSKRRINFYIRNGARLSDREYIQPPYSPTRSSMPLKIMYFGDEPTEEDVKLMKHNCYPISYVEDCILPLYDHYDAAHRRDHILEVIHRSLEIKTKIDRGELGEHIQIDEDLLFMSAAYHDLGMDQGRELHHLHSAERLRKDPLIRTWYTDEEIRIMAEAIEDHRSSKGTFPRNIYGKIIAEADRTIDPETILSRTLLFGMDHYPDFNQEEHYQRFREHLQEKYSEHGYLKLIFQNTENSRKLQELQKIIADEEELRHRFDQLYSKLKRS